MDLIFTLCPPPPRLPPPLSPPSFVIPSLCFAPMALLSFLLLFTLTAPFTHCLPSCLQLQHSHCSYTAGIFTFSQHQSLVFSPFKKSKNQILKKIDWGASCGSGVIVVTPPQCIFNKNAIATAFCVDKIL